jgi:hypothetical protein
MRAMSAIGERATRGVGCTHRHRADDGRPRGLNRVVGFEQADKDDVGRAVRRRRFHQETDGRDVRPAPGRFEAKLGHRPLVQEEFECYHDSNYMHSERDPRGELRAYRAHSRQRIGCRTQSPGH